MLFCHQVTDMPANSSSWISDKWALRIVLLRRHARAVAGSVARQALPGCAQPGGVLRTGRDCPITVEAVVCNRVSVPTPTPLASTLPYSNQDSDGLMNAAADAPSVLPAWLNAVAVDKAHLDVLFQHTRACSSSLPLMFRLQLSLNKVRCQSAPANFWHRPLRSGDGYKSDFALPLAALFFKFPRRTT